MHYDRLGQARIGQR